MPANPSEDATEELIARFISEYLKDLNGTRAAKRAGAPTKYPNMFAWRLLQREDIQERIAKANAERLAAVKLDANEVLRQVHARALADPNEIVQIRRGCCRHCYGTGFKRQYTNERELRAAQAAFELSTEALVEGFEHGGLGFDSRKQPNPECPECGGEGGAYVHVNDTRDLSPAARALFAGAKQTKDGIEVKLHSQDKNLELLMRHLGLLKDELTIKGDLGERILRARKRVRGS